MYSLGEIKSHKYGDFQSLYLKESDILDGNQVYLEGEFLDVALRNWRSKENKNKLIINDEALANKLNKLQQEISKQTEHVFRPYKEDSDIYVKLYGKDIPVINKNNYVKIHVFSVFKDQAGHSFLQIKLADFGPFYNI